jgi:nucleoid DNA-binding protein
MPKLKTVGATEFVDLVADRLEASEVTKADVKAVLGAMTSEVADCIANGFGVKVGSIVKLEPRYKAPIPKGKRSNPFKPDEPPKMMPAKPAGVRVAANALIGAKRDIPGPKTAAFDKLVKKLPKPKKRKAS